MKTSKAISTIATVALLLVVSNVVFFSEVGQSITNALNSPTNVSSTSSYGDLLQYEWPQSQGNSAFTRFSAGPAPEAPDILWKANITGIQSYLTAFNGVVFASTKTKVFALDRETGNTIWNTTIPAPGSWPKVFKIDDTHMVSGSSCLDPATGLILWTSPIFSATPAPLFTDSVYSPEERMFYTQGNSSVQAWNFSDPSQPPKLAWQTYVQGSGLYGSGIQYGGGKIFSGSYQSHQIAIDAKSGDVLWDTETTGPMLFSGTYAQGKFFRGGTHDNTFYAFDASDGRTLWTFKPETEDGYWCSGTAAAYGMVYGINKDGNLYAIDQNTGKVVWKYKGPGPLLFPGTPTIADGKIYVTTGQEALYGGLSSTSEFACLDAYTGQLVWKLPIEAFAPKESVAIAYGNLYLIPADVTTAVDSVSGEEYATINQIWAMGTRDWSMFRHDSAHTGVGQSGPTNLTLRWNFTTDGAVISSPTVANSRVYFGSQDKNIYAVDARSGDLIWKFTVGDRVESSLAVVNGKVYTGTDDGYVYCLDAYNGSLIWKTFAGGFIPANFAAAVILRSSPIVVGDYVYVGALDNKTYCINANDGVVKWAFQTQGYITSSPAVVDGAVYITSQEPTLGALYKLDANTGYFVWKRSLPYFTTLGGGTDMHGSPTVADGSVFTSSNIKAYYAVNAISGDIEWTYKDENAGEFIVSSPIYADGRLFLIDRFSIVCVNPKTGITIWSSFLGDELYVSPSYADGKLYVVTDQRSLFVLNATDGSKLGKFSTRSSSWSSPSIYEGKIYVGNNDWNVYCIAEYPAQSSNISVALNKSVVYEDELVTGFGQLIPRLDNTNVTVTITQPDGATIVLPVVTSFVGEFTFTFAPSVAGTWIITAQWTSDKSYYDSSTSAPASLLVDVTPTPTPTESPTPSPTPTLTPTSVPTPTPFEKQMFMGVPVMDIYMAAIFGLIAAIGVAGYILRRRVPK
jgi:eukaryotic-like serine/threonine-protein kinase